MSNPFSLTPHNERKPVIWIARELKVDDVDNAKRSYKHAIRYFGHALTHFKKSGLNEAEKKMLAELEKRFDALDQDPKHLDAETAEAAQLLFDEAHDYFDPNN